MRCRDILLRSGFCRLFVVPKRHFLINCFELGMFSVLRWDVCVDGWKRLLCSLCWGHLFLGRCCLCYMRYGHVQFTRSKHVHALRIWLGKLHCGKQLVLLLRSRYKGGGKPVHTLRCRQSF